MRIYRNLFTIFGNFRQFKETLAETGLLRYGMITHILFSATGLLTVYLLLPTFFIPVTIGVLSHIITDLPNVKKIKTIK